MRIGELSKQTGFTQETIRYYERISLLPKPYRNAANYREYGEKFVDRLRFIANCRSLDMTLNEVRHLLELRDNPQARCGEANRLLDEHLQHVRQRMAELTQLSEQLEAIQTQCPDDRITRDCGILNELGRMDQAAPASEKSAGASHVPGSHGHRL